jgi:hypothetical protein
VLAKMPLRFLHVLRDIRLKQIEEKNKRLSQQQATVPNTLQPTAPIGGLSSDVLEELVEELT